MQCGLLGEKLSHSYSPQIHRFLGQYAYSLYEVAAEEVGNFVNSGTFSGINVTIPYKKTVIPYCQTLSDRAQLLGSVNTIVRQEDGSLFGHNSDYFGFSYLLQHVGVNVENKKALVLGSGGSSVTVCAVLRDAGADVVVISRSGKNNYSNLHLHKDASLIVNTTPVGMYPNNGNSPIDLSVFSCLECVLDIIYNPARTQLLLDAEHLGIPNANGLRMLIAQAKESAQYFTGKEIPDAVIEDIYRVLRNQEENLILVGMPGSGKSTIGKALAKSLHKTFIDADDEITKCAGMPIPEIFRTQGEPGFRRIETEVLRELGKKSRCVIATGGGCVTIPDNYQLLHQNGTIVWIQRDITQLPTVGRPLSQTQSLVQMHETRMPKYQAFADIVIQNNGSVDDAYQKIMTLLEGRQAE